MSRPSVCRALHVGAVAAITSLSALMGERSVLLAQIVPTPSVATPSEPAPNATSTVGWHVEQCMGGITYGAPLKFAVSYGGGFLRESNNGPDVCALGVAKLGLGGAQLSAGIGTSFAPWGTGVMVTGNVLRTFAKPLHATAQRNYVGASVHLWPAFALGGELGYFVRLGDAVGASDAGKRVVSWSLGFGF